MFLDAVVSSTWFDSGCGAGPRARWLDGGAIEIEGEGVVKKALPAAVKQWSTEISAVASKFDLWPNFIAGFIATESGGDKNAHSYCCYGLMGLLPATASSMAGRPVSSTELLENAALNIELGAKYVDQLMAKYKDNPIKTAAGYNAGSAKCGAGKCGVPNRFNLVADCVDGKAVDYVSRIIGYSNAARGDLPVTIPKSSGGASPLLLAAGAALIIGGAIYFSRGARA